MGDHLDAFPEREVRIEIARTAEGIAANISEPGLRAGRIKPRDVHTGGGHNSGSCARIPQCRSAKSRENFWHNACWGGRVAVVGSVQQSSSFSIPHRERKAASGKQSARNIPTLQDIIRSVAKRQPLNGEFPEVVETEVVSDIIICRTVHRAEIIRILLIERRSVGSAEKLKGHW